MPPTVPRPAGPAPDQAALHAAALLHLSRFAATEAGLVRVLDRRVLRWARAAGAEGRGVEAEAAAARLAARRVARALAESGVVDDAAFAAARVRRLARAGRSRRASSAHLAAKGVPPEVAAAALPGAEDELSAALAFARRRRLGPFRVISDAEPDADLARREMGALARAGFQQDTASRALGMTPEEAEALLHALRRG